MVTPFKAVSSDPDAVEAHRGQLEIKTLSLEMNDDRTALGDRIARLASQ